MNRASHTFEMATWKKRFACLFVLFAASCSSVYPLVGATVVGTGTALVNPFATPLGITAGWAMGELAKTEGAVEEAEVQIDELTETVKALSTGDVEALVKQRMDKAMNEQRGFFDGIIDEFYSLLKLVAIVATMAFLAHFAWTVHRRKRGESFYAEIEDIKNKLK